MKYRRISLTEARKNFVELIEQVEAGENIVLTRRGKPIAIMIATVADRSSHP
jgi:prevent-host-death family protein